MRKLQQDDEEGHVPSWPRYIERTFVNRTLAYYDAGRHMIVDEEGREYVLSESVDNFVDNLFKGNLLLFVDSLAAFSFLPELVANPRNQATCNKKGEPLCIKIKGPHNGTRWVVRSEAWSMPAGKELLQVLRQTYKHCEVGTQSTPGGLGQALMRQSYRETYGECWWMHRHYRPGMPVCRMFFEHGTGGRVDTPGLHQYFEILYEYDRKNAYLAECLFLPAGTAVRIFDQFERQCYETWFVHCTVTIPEGKKLALGPFPVRIEEGEHSFPVYPKEPGEYDAWLWREEIEDCQAFGLTVAIIEGYAWERFTEDLAPWVLKMSQLRDSAPTPEVESFEKGAIVAGLGRFGMADVLYTLVSEDQAGPNDAQIAEGIGNGEGLLYEWYIKAIRDAQYNGHPHWFYYIIMQCRRKLFWDALPHAQAEHLAATNYDAIYSTEDMINVPVKGTREAKLVATGGMRKRVLHGKPGEESIPAPRALNMQEIYTRPGEKRATRHVITDEQRKRKKRKGNNYESG